MKIAFYIILLIELFKGISAQQITEVSGVIDNSEFIFIKNQLDLDFRRIIIDCRRRGAEAASIKSQREFAFVNRLADLVSGAGAGRYYIGRPGLNILLLLLISILTLLVAVGLFDPRSVGGNGNTRRFRFVDGSLDGREFFERPFVRPWSRRDPDGNPVGGEPSNCVA